MVIKVFILIIDGAHAVGIGGCKAKVLLMGLSNNVFMNAIEI